MACKRSGVRVPPAPLDLHEYTVTQDCLRDTGREGQLMIVSHDIPTEVIDALKDGSLMATIDQQQYLQGYLPIHWLYLHKAFGFNAGGDVLTGTAVVNEANVDQVVAMVEAGYR